MQKISYVTFWLKNKFFDENKKIIKLWYISEKCEYICNIYIFPSTIF